MFWICMCGYRRVYGLSVYLFRVYVMVPLTGYMFVTLTALDILLIKNQNMNYILQSLFSYTTTKVLKLL